MTRDRTPRVRGAIVSALVTLALVLTSRPFVAAEASTTTATGQVTGSGDGAQRRGGEEVSFAIEHSLDGATFVNTGVITGKLAVDRSDPRNFRLSAARATRTALDAASASALNALVENDGTYRVRIPSNIVSAREGSYVMASLPARCLSAASLADALTLHTDDRGNAYGVEYATASGECAVTSTDGAVAKVKAGMNFRTTVSVRVPKDAPGLNPNAPTDLRGGGPVSEKHKASQKNSQRGGKSSTDSPKPPQTFMQKHWMKMMLAFYGFAFVCAPPPPPKRTKPKTQ